MKRKILAFANAVFILYLLSSGIACNRQSSYAHWSGGLIHSFGTYTLDDSSYTIKVFQKNGLIDYHVSDRSSSVLFQAREHASAYQGWLMYWDKHLLELWIQSSDIGLFVWQKDAHGVFHEITLASKDSNVIKTMPAEFFNQLPDFDKRFCQASGYVDEK